MNVLFKEMVTASFVLTRGEPLCLLIHWDPEVHYHPLRDYICVECHFTLAWFMVDIVRLMILFHNLGLGDDKTVVKPRKQKRGKCFSVFLGSLENI